MNTHDGHTQTLRHRDPAGRRDAVGDRLLKGRHWTQLGKSYTEQ